MNKIYSVLIGCFISFIAQASTVFPGGGFSAIKGFMGVGIFQVALAWKNAARANASLTKLMGPVGPAVAEAGRRALTKRYVKEGVETMAAKKATPPVNFCADDVCDKYKLVHVVSAFI